MQTGNFQSLAKASAVLFVDHTLLPILYTDNGQMLKEMYDEVYVTPALYNYYAKLLGINALKLVQKYAKRQPEWADQPEPIDGLTDDEAFAVGYCIAYDVDLVIDDPIKAKEIARHGVHVVRLSDIISAAATA